MPGSAGTLNVRAFYEKIFLNIMKSCLLKVAVIKKNSLHLSNKTPGESREEIKSQARDVFFGKIYTFLFISFIQRNIMNVQYLII